MVVLLVIVLAANVEGIAPVEAKGDTVLLVHPNAEAAGLITAEFFKPIAGGLPQRIQKQGGIQIIKFATDDRPERFRQRARRTAVHTVENIGGGVVGEGPNHGTSIHA